MTPDQGSRTILDWSVGPSVKTEESSEALLILASDVLDHSVSKMGPFPMYGGNVSNDPGPIVTRSPLTKSEGSLLFMISTISDLMSQRPGI